MILQEGAAGARPASKAYKAAGEKEIELEAKVDLAKKEIVFSVDGTTVSDTLRIPMKTISYVGCMAEGEGFEFTDFDIQSQ